MEYLLAGIVGLIVSIALTIFLNRKEKAVGDLRIDHSDPDNPYLFLELNIGLEELSKKNEVVLRVKLKDYISQK